MPLLPGADPRAAVRSSELVVAKAVSRLMFFGAAVAGGFGGWALFGAVAKPDEKAASTGATGATASTGVATVSTLSPPTVTIPPAPTTVPRKHKSKNGQPPPPLPPPPPPPPTTHATFTINGKVYDEHEYLDVTTSGYVKPLDYSGPSGCAGRFFYIGQTAAFRYTAHNALLQTSSVIYTFGYPPKVEHGTLVWNVTFTGQGRSDHIKAVVHCPLPPTRIPALPSYGS